MDAKRIEILEEINSMLDAILGTLLMMRDDLIEIDKSNKVET